jgi:hypothetical protein
MVAPLPKTFNEKSPQDSKIPVRKFSFANKSRTKNPPDCPPSVLGHVRGARKRPASRNFFARPAMRDADAASRTKNFVAGAESRNAHIAKIVVAEKREAASETQTGTRRSRAGNQRFAGHFRR